MIHAAMPKDDARSANLLALWQTLDVVCFHTPHKALFDVDSHSPVTAFLAGELVELKSTLDCELPGA
jgi:hypothetical protein